MCKHLNLYFGSGTYYIFCRSCPAIWCCYPETSTLTAENRLHACADSSMGGDRIFVKPQKDSNDKSN